MTTPEQFATALTVILANDTAPEQRSALEQMVTGFRAEVGAFPVIMNVIQSHPNVTIRRFAISCLRVCLNKNWKVTMLPSDAREQVKEGLLNLLRNDRDLTNRHCIVQAIKCVLKTDACRWPALLEAVSRLSESPNWEDTETAMYIITHIVQRLAPVDVSRSLEFFLGLASRGLGQTEQPPLAITAAGLVAVITVEISEEELSLLSGAFQTMIKVYGSMLVGGNETLMAGMAEKISYAVHASKLPIPVEALLLELFSFAQHNPTFAYIPIIDLVKSHGHEISGDAIAVLIRETLNVAALVFNSDPSCSISDMDDLKLIISTIRYAAKVMKSNVFFGALLNMATGTLQHRGPAAIVAGMAIDEVVEFCQSEAVQRMSELGNFLNGLLTIDTLAAKETVVEVIGDLAKLLDDGDNAIGNKFIIVMLGLLDMGNPDLSARTIKALTKLLSCCNVEFVQIEPVLGRVIALLDKVEAPGDVVACLSALVFSADEDIRPFATRLFPVFMKGADVKEVDDPILRANIIEAMSNMVRFASVQLGDLASKAVEFIVSSGQTEDCDIRAAVMAAISNIMVLPEAATAPLAVPVAALINQYISEDLASEEHDDPEDDMDNSDEDGRGFIKSQSLTNSITNTILLIKNIFKRAPHLVPVEPGHWIEFCLKRMDAYFDDLVIAATTASRHIAMKIPSVMGPLFVALMKNLEENESATVVASIFRVVTKCMDSGVDIPEQVAREIMTAAGQALTGDLACQDVEGLDDEGTGLLLLTRDVYSFYAALATKNVAAFPVQAFVDHRKRNETNFEKSQYIGVLRQVYKMGHSKLSPLVGKIVVKTFVEDLTICDFTVLPEPIFALRDVFVIAPTAIRDEWMESALRFVGDLLGRENDGEMHYWTTMTAIVSFVCSLIQAGSARIDIAVWLPPMLKVLPVRGDEIEAQNIYSTLTTIVSQHGSELGALTTEIIRVFAQTIGLKDSILSSYHLSDETAHSIVSQLRHLMGDSAETRAHVIQTILSDDASRARFSTRVP